MSRPREADACVIVGNVNLDLVMGPQAPWPRPGTEVLVEASEFRVGGAAGNTSLALTALGVEHRLAASTGDDALGRWLAEPFGALARAWPATGTTAISVGIAHPDGERTFFTDPGHLRAFDLKAVLAQIPGRAPPGAVALLVGAFVLPALLPDMERLMAALAGRGYTVALDTGWPDGGWSGAVRARVTGWLPGCGHLLLNEAEACGLAGHDTVEAAADALAARLPPGATLVVKRGPEGATARRGAERAAAAAPPVAVVDTIGAGDIFNAGYLSAVLEGRPLVQAVADGVAIASRAIATRPRRYR